MICLVLSAGGPALAEVASGGGEEDAHAEAMARYRAAEERYREGRFEEAVELLREAIAIQDIPALHHNLGRALQELGRWEEARAEYLAYLEREPSSYVRPRIEARISQLERLMAERDAEDETGGSGSPESPEEEEEEYGGTDDTPLDPTDSEWDDEPGRRILPWPWAIAGVGGAALVTAVVLAALFEVDVATARDPETSHLQAVEARDRAEAYGIAATTLFVVGGLVAAGGITWGLLDLLLPRGGDDGGLSLRLGPFGLALAGSFD